ERDEGEPTAVPRHRLGGAQEVPRTRRLDPLLAGDQRDLTVALEGPDPVVDLAREQAQRKTDRPARMAAQPLYREVRLAGIGRAEHGPQPAVGRGSDHGPANVAARAARRKPRRPQMRGFPPFPRLGAKRTRLGAVEWKFTLWRQGLSPQSRSGSGRSRPCLAFARA